MSGIFRACLAELRAVFADRAVLVVMLGGSLFYALFYPLPYRAQVATGLPVLIVDQDFSASSRRLARWLDASEPIRVDGVLASARPAQEALRRKQIAGYVEIPTDFERKLLRGEPAQVGVFANAAYMVLFSQVAAASNDAALALGALEVEQRQLRAGRDAGTAAALASPIRIELHELYNPDGGYANYVVPAVLVLIVQQTFLIGICMLQVGRRRESAVLSTVLGRVAAHVLLQVAVFTFYLAVLYRLFGFPSEGSALLALVALLPAFIAVAGLGLALGPWFRSRETALQTMMLASVPALFLAGFAWPAEAMPAALVAVGQWLPSTGAIDAFVRVHQMGAGLDEIAATSLRLWLLAGFYLLLGIARVRRSSIASAPL